MDLHEKPALPELPRFQAHSAAALANWDSPNVTAAELRLIPECLAPGHFEEKFFRETGTWKHRESLLAVEANLLFKIKAESGELIPATQFKEYGDLAEAEAQILAMGVTRLQNHLHNLRQIGGGRAVAAAQEVPATAPSAAERGPSAAGRALDITAQIEGI